jgi:5'(3')-deoxyribonucleotidase
MKRYIPLFEANASYTVYIDMDGVLCDFLNGFRKFFDISPDVLSKSESAKLINSISHWYYKLSAMPKAKLLFNSIFVNYKNIKILTTPFLSVNTCKEDKINWVKDNVGDIEVIFALNKEDYANSKAILIDDRKENIDAFINAGGIGILYDEKNFNSIIKRLKTLAHEYEERY